LLKINRVYLGGYVPNWVKIQDLGYLILKLPKPIITVLSSDQGFGVVKGTTKKLGQNYSPVPVCCFKRSTRQLLWETVSKPDGTYSFRNIAVGLECFVVAFDPNGQYNAVISDKLVAK
jgi:hypothetical protein